MEVKPEVGNKPVKLEEPGLANREIGTNPVQGSCNFTANIGTRSNVGDNLCRSTLISLLGKGREHLAELIKKSFQGGFHEFYFQCLSSICTITSGLAFVLVHL